MEKISVRYIDIPTGERLLVFNDPRDAWRWQVNAFRYGTKEFTESWFVDVASLPCNIEVISKDGTQSYYRKGKPVGSPWLNGANGKLIEDAALLEKLDGIFHICGGWNLWDSASPAEQALRDQLDTAYASQLSARTAGAEPPMVELGSIA